MKINARKTYDCQPSRTDAQVLEFCKSGFLMMEGIVGRLFRGESTQRKKKNMHIFITSTIIDPAGNPVNTEETLPFMRQPAGEVPNFRGLQP